MEFEYLQNVTLNDARTDYLNALRSSSSLIGEEEISATSAAGRVSSRPAYAVISSPHFTAAAMDGIALSARLTFGASETTPIDLSPDAFAIVDTGDPLPEGTDCVIMVEDLVKQKNGAMRIYAPAVPWQNVRQIGEDLCQGEMILPSATLISPPAVGALLAAGIGKIWVRKQPIVGIIPSGDEIIAPSDAPKPGEIIEFNSAVFKGMLESWGARAVVYPIVSDQPEQLTAAVLKAAAECDVILLNAGSSAGRDDHTARILRENGKLLTHGIAIRPGKPAVLGILNGKPFIGVPGYPVSGVIILEEIVKPLLCQLLGIANAKKPTCQAILTRRLMSSLKYQEFARVKVGYIDQKLTAVPLDRGAGVITSLVKADGIAIIPQDVEGWDAGQVVEVELSRPIEQIRKTISCIGSHDPLMDEIGDLIRRDHAEFFFSSAHVGSMGGIMAIKRGEAHLAGIHLLDEESGTYNLEALKKPFPNGGVRLLRGVKRQQGLILPKGNPKNIRQFSDIAREGISYVNRQKGAGTRVLLDYLLKRNEIPAESVYGYSREELTHLSVAVQIASGSADAGMGIYSAAAAYGLDFLPICVEEYDFLILESFLKERAYAAFFATITSQAFRDRLMAAGGYEIDRIGEIKR